MAEKKRIKSPVGKKTTVIFTALKEAYDQLDTQGEKIDAITTDLVKAQEAAAKAIASANENNIDAIKALLSQLEGAQDQYDKLKVAIAEKAEEIKNVHGIELEANTLSALIVAKENTLKEKEEQATLIIAEATEKAEALVASAEEQAKDTLETAEAKAEAQRLELEEQATVTARDCSRASEQYEFEFGIRKRNAEQQLQDKLAADGRSLDEKAAALNAKTDEYKAKDVQIIELTKEVTTLINTKESDILKRVKDAETKLSTSFSIEKKWIQKDHDTKISIESGKLENALANNADLKAHIAKLEAALESANVKVADIAQSALIDANNDKTITSLTAALTTANQGKK